VSAVVVAAPDRVEDPTVRAAGALLWRPATDGLEVAVVHRPKYDDWSWPKGKLEPQESWPAAAVREVLEETGLQVHLGVPLPHASYLVGGVGGRPRPKVVLYWAARVVAGSGDLTEEVDQVEWLPVDVARSRLGYRRDRAQLGVLADACLDDVLDTWPLLLVRHATSLPRRRWKGEDARRPLDERGREHALGLVPTLAAYGVTRVLTSDSDRCAATVAPYARFVGATLRSRHSLSEEGFADDPARADRTLRRALDRAEPTLLCSHRPVLPALLRDLAERASGLDVRTALLESAGPGLVKGEVLVAHVHGAGDQARVVAVERHGRR
jgi:8-oxo-dGTP pyrophosphatase MutT (NUDIX family)/phosphohistidine phosphatase SixA